MNKKYYDALDDVLDRPIAFNPAFKKITGRTSAAVWLSQVYYWSKRTSDPDGWFWKTAKECQEETGLTDNEQKTAREICVRLGVVEEKLKGVPATLHYRLIKPRMYELLGLQIPTQQETEIPDEPETRKPPSRKQESRKAGNINKESENTAETTQRESPALDFKNMTVPEARKVPTLKLYADATDYFPGSVVWEYVHDEITKHNLTFERIHAAAVAWTARGFKQSNVQGVLEWAVSGVPNGKGPQSAGPAPAINTAAIEATRRMLDEKHSGEFAPPPPGSRPQIQIKQLAERKGISK